MILVNTVPNPKPLAPNLQQLYNRKVSISSYSKFFGGYEVFLGGKGGTIFLRLIIDILAIQLRTGPLVKGPSFGTKLGS